MRTLLPALGMLALGGLSDQAGAQAPCPEFTRLRSEAVAAQKPVRFDLFGGRCDTYIRISNAWRAVLRYAEDNRAACDISIGYMGEIEKYYAEAVRVRDNICTGRPARPFPPDIIQR